MGTIFSMVEVMHVLTLTKNGLGYILGDFLHKTHPVTLVRVHIPNLRPSSCVFISAFIVISCERLNSCVE
jgi:hypothetical protein